MFAIGAHVRPNAEAKAYYRGGDRMQQNSDTARRTMVLGELVAIGDSYYRVRDFQHGWVNTYSMHTLELDEYVIEELPV